MTKIFASNLLARREIKRYTQSYVAFLCGMSQPNYSDIERGKTNPSVYQLKKFAEVLDVTVDELLAEEPLMQPPPQINGNSPTRRALTGEEKDTYIKILEERIRVLLREKDMLLKRDQ